MNEDNNKSKKSLIDLVKKYNHIIILAFLSVFLMIFFRYNKQEINQFIESSKSSLLSFYTQNMKPLLATTEISNEDIFNFALYQKLPIDRDKKKVLFISNNNSGDQVYELQPAQFNPSTNNYERFVDYLGLSQNEKSEVDSVLNAYKEEIYFSILTNDKNTVAISPKLAGMQNAILSDIIFIVEKADNKLKDDILPTLRLGIDSREFQKYTMNTKDIPQQDYIFITPDSVFQKEIKIDKKPVDDILKKYDWTKHSSKNDMKIDIVWDKENIRKNHRPDKNEFRYSLHLDTNLVKVVIQEFPASPESFIRDSLRTKLNRYAEKFRKFSVELKSDESNTSSNDNKERRRRTDVSKTPSQFHFNFEDPSGIAKYTFEIMSKIDYKNLEEFGKKMDSLGRAFKIAFKDSITVKNSNYENYLNRMEKMKDLQKKNETKK